MQTIKFTHFKEVTAHYRLYMGYTEYAHLNPDNIDDVQDSILDSYGTLDELGEQNGSILIDYLIEPGVLVVYEFGLDEYWAAQGLNRDKVESYQHLPGFFHNFTILRG